MRPNQEHEDQEHEDQENAAGNSGRMPWVVDSVGEKKCPPPTRPDKPVVFFVVPFFQDF